MAPQSRSFTINNETLTVKEWAARKGMTVEGFRKRIRLCMKEDMKIEKVLDDDFWKHRSRFGKNGKARKQAKIFDTKYGPLTYLEMAERAGISYRTIKTRMTIVRRLGLEVEKVMDNDFFQKRLKEGRAKGRKTVKARHHAQEIDLEQKYITRLLNNIPLPSPIERQMEDRGWL